MAVMRRHSRGMFAIGVIATMFLLVVACGESATKASVPVAVEPGAPSSTVEVESPSATSEATTTSQSTAVSPAATAMAEPTDPQLVNTPVAVANSAPDFTLPSILGPEYTLSSFQGERPVLVVFYRAYW